MDRTRRPSSTEKPKPHRIRVDSETYLALGKLKTRVDQDLGDVVAEIVREYRRTVD